MDNKDFKELKLTQDNIESIIYEIRGQKVMLDSDLASICGYYTKRFNEQVKNNIEKFDEDFILKLTKDELKDLSRQQIGKEHDSSLRPTFSTINKSGNMRVNILSICLMLSQSKVFIC